MRIPIPTVQRQVLPQAAGAGPMLAGVPPVGAQNLGEALFNVGATMQRDVNIEAERAARETADKLAKVEHEQRKARVMERSRDDRLKWQETMQQRQTDAPEGADGFTPSVLKDFDTYREEALKTVTDPEERAMYDGMLGSLREHVGERALVFQAQSRQQFRARTLTEGLDKSARLVTVDPSQMPDVLAQELALIKSSTDLSAEQKAKLTDHAKDTLSWAATQTLVDRNPDAFLERVGVRGGKPDKKGNVPQQDVEKAAQAVQGDAVLSQLPPARLQQAIDRATMLSVTRKAQIEAERERQERRAEAAANKAFREATAAYTVMEGMISAGRAIDMTNPTNIDNIRKIQAVPEYANAFKSAMSDLPKNVAVSMQPIGQQQVTLNALYQQRNTKGSSPGLEKEIQRVEAVLDASRKGYSKDPLQYVVDVGVVPKMAPMELSSLDTMMRDLPARVEQARAASRSGAVNAAPFTASEAPAIERMFASWSPQQQADAIGKMAGAVPPEQMTALAKLIDPKNRPLTLAMQAGGARTSQNRFTSELILLGAQKFTDTKTGQASEKGDAVRQRLRADITQYIDGDQPGMATITGEAREAAIEAAIYINAGLEATGGTYSGPERAATLALNGKVETHAGKRIPLPPGQTYDQFRSVLTNYPATDLSAQTKDGVFYGASKMTLDEFRRELPTMPLQPAGDGRYFVRSGAGLVKGANGRPIVIKGQ